MRSGAGARDDRGVIAEGAGIEGVHEEDGVPRKPAAPEGDQLDDLVAEGVEIASAE